MKITVPQVLHIGPWSLRVYGVCMALAVLAGYIVAHKRRVRFGLESESVDKILFWVVIFGFVGARVYHVLSDAQYYITQPFEMVQVWHGGLSIYGALIGGLIGLVVYVRTHYLLEQRRVTVLKLLDWLVPSVLLGQIIGRFGNFFNYELYGYPTELPWKMFVPTEFRSPGYFAQEYYHPLFLYEALVTGLILFVLLRFVDGKARSGALFFWYILLYNIGRFFLEFLRIDAVFAGDIRVNAVVSAGLAAIASIVLIITYARKVPQVH